MTHTLHRKGTVESLSSDYLVFAIAAQGINSVGSASKFPKIMEVMLSYNPVNYGDMRTGNSYSVSKEQILDSFKDNSIFHAVYTDAETVAKVLAELKKLDTGLSVVVSGLTDKVVECCQKNGLKEHTINKSLGIWGNTDRLPADDVVQVTTMCGHGMVAFSLVEDLARKVNRGMDSQKAAVEMARLCHCGIFNTDRAAAIIEKLAAELNK